MASLTALAPFDDPNPVGKLTEHGSAEVNMSSWIWSSEHEDFYYATREHSGKWTYHWYKQMPQPTPMVAATSELQSRTIYDASFPKRSDSIIAVFDNSPEKPVSVPAEIARTIPNLIPGTPNKGWYEPLDSSYRMRTGSDAHRFFKIGKVFAMLYTQLSTDLAGPGIDNITIVKYGEKVYSQVRRFVVVRVRRGFVYACPISTYSGRGTLKPGVRSEEHSIVYFVGTTPVPLQSEYLTKDSIAIMPADVSQVMSAGSRLNYAKAYPIEMNVKAKDIGNVIPEHLPKLVSYYSWENNFPEDPDFTHSLATLVKEGGNVSTVTEGGLVEAYPMHC